LQTSLEKLVAIYTDSLSAAEMKAENSQSLTVDGVTVEGQKLTAALDAAKTSEMVKAIAQMAKSMIIFIRLYQTIMVFCRRLPKSHSKHLRKSSPKKITENSSTSFFSG
jgi:hypothetical protein